MTQTRWATPAAEAFELNNTLHIWKIYFPDFKEGDQPLFTVLNESERDRAGRFYFAADRKRYLVTRALLKIILGHTLSLPPAEIFFSYSEHGKPGLQNSNSLHFNISHSGDMGLIALSDRAAVGVDVEQFRPRFKSDKVARRFFSDTEFETFRQLPQNQKIHGFFNCWTRKEALIKALGLGLTMPLKSFDVTLKPGETVRLLNVSYNDEHADGWSLGEINLGGDYAAAYAVKAKNFKLFFWSVKGLIDF